MVRAVSLFILFAGSIPSIARAEPADAEPQLRPPSLTPPLAPALAVDGHAHHGPTFEANVGIGYLHSANPTTFVPTYDSRAALVGGLGVGGWIRPKMALTLRVAVVQADVGNFGTFDPPGTPAITGISAFIGPSLQVWNPGTWQPWADNFWIGVGGGVSVQGVVSGKITARCTDGANGACADLISRTGLGFDLRAGYSFEAAGDRLNLSVELTPGFGGGLGGDSGMGVALLVGYQNL